MDKLSLFVIITVTAPELICGIHMGFLAIGEKKNLILNNKQNIFRMLACVALMSLTVFIVRAVAPNRLIILGLNTIAYVIIIKFVYKFSWYKAAMAVGIFVSFIIVVEDLYCPQIAAFIDVNWQTDLYRSDMVRLIYSIPARVLQLTAIIILFNIGIVLINLKKYKEIRTSASGAILTILIAEVILTHVLVNNLSVLNLRSKIEISIGCILLIASSIFLTRLITKFTAVADLTVVNERKELGKNMNMLYDLIVTDQLDKAKTLCKNLFNKEDKEAG